MAKRIHRAKIDEDQFVIRSGEFLAAALPVWEKHKTQITRGLIGLAALIVAGFLVGSSLQKSAERVRAGLDDALAAAGAGSEVPEPPSAAQRRDRLEAFLREHPSGTPAAWAHLHLAQALIEENQAEPAAAHYRQFLSLAPPQAAPLGRMGLAFALLKAGKPAEAIAEWEALKALGWTGEELDLEIATARLQIDRDKAIAELEALAGKQDSPVAPEAKQRLQLHAPKPGDVPVLQGGLAPEAAAASSATPQPEAEAAPEPTGQSPSTPESAPDRPAAATPEPSPGP